MSIAIDLTTASLTSLDGRENRWANDNDGFALAAHPRKEGAPQADGIVLRAREMFKGCERIKTL